MSDHFKAEQQGHLGAIFGIPVLLAVLSCAASAWAQDATIPAPDPVPAEVAPAPVAAPAPAAFPTESVSTPPTTYRPRHPHRRGLIIAGAATWGGGYLFSVLVGALLYQEDANPATVCLNCDEAWKMFVPLIGPFMFLPDADGADGKAVAAVMGGVQVIGFGLLLGGIIHAAIAHKRADEQTVGMTLSRDGVPQITLRF